VFIRTAGSVHSRCEEQISDNNTRFDKFVEASKETMEENVPKREKKKTALRSSDPRVVEARGKADKAKTSWEAEQSDDSKYAWKQALKSIYTIYDQVKEQELEDLITNIEATAIW